jgi:hypothetical protein
MGRFFAAVLVTSSVALQLGLAAGGLNGRDIHLGEKVSGAFGLMAILFGVIAASNLWASKSGGAYVTVLPVIRRWPLNPGVSVAVGLVVGLLFGVCFWT